MTADKIIEQAKYALEAPKETLTAVRSILKTRYPYMSGGILVCTDPNAHLIFSAQIRGTSITVKAWSEEDIASIKTVAEEVLAEATNQTSISLEWDRA